MLQPPHRLDDDRDRADHQEHAVGLRGEHLRSLEAEGVAFGRRALREDQRDQGQRERQHIGGHVRGVGEQRQAAEEVAADDLDHEEDRVGSQRDQQ